MAIGDKIVLPDKRTLDLAKNKVDNIYAVVPTSVAVPEPSPLDKNYIADKATLDELKTKLDNLPVFTPDGTASSSEVLSGKTFLNNSISKQTGTMPNRGAISATLTTQGANCQIPNGYHNGSGKVTASFANLIASNIKQGVNVGGVVGTANSTKTVYIRFRFGNYFGYKVLYINGIKFEMLGLPRYQFSEYYPLVVIGNSRILTFQMHSIGTYAYLSPDVNCEQDANVSASVVLDDYLNSDTDGSSIVAINSDFVEGYKYTLDIAKKGHW